MLGAEPGSFSLINCYIIISGIVIIVDILSAYHAYIEKKNHSGFLAITCLFAGLVQLTYLFSIFPESYFAVSFFSSLYFLSVDFTVLSLLIFVRAYTYHSIPKWNGVLEKILLGYQCWDILIFTVNLFAEIVIHYVDQGGVIGRYNYQMKPLYYIHLGYSYLMVLIVIFLFLKSALSIPKEYRKPFYLCVFCILGVVAFNGLFLYFPGFFNENNLDYSIWGYSLAAFMIYYLCFRYPVNGMKPYYHNWIVHNINQGVVLFNYEDSMIIYNDKMKQLFPDCEFRVGMNTEEFARALKLEIREGRSKEDYSFQHYMNKDGKEIPIRFDHRCLKGGNDVVLGQLFAFTDEKGDIDLLTSFYSWDYFKNDLQENPNVFHGSLTVAVCDLDGLRGINAGFGKSAGDRAIELVSLALRRHFSGESYYIRGEEANLIVINYEMDQQQAAKKMENVKNELLKNDEIGTLLVLQSAIATREDPNIPIMTVVEQALKTMQNKKLLDSKSHRSELVSSLVKTLSECDQDTEAHVKRTQIIGAELGKRLGLSDMQLSDLALLCILHDIGKIAIPLEILNKPGKLTEAEWRVMKSHVQKGYQIANSSTELCHISDMILHHHEFWNGKGYPDGLTKESIPLLSRIISVVDAYDAMVSDRTYRKAMSQEDALAELKRCAGTQFDPGIVNEFVQMIPGRQGYADDSQTDTAYFSAEPFGVTKPLNREPGRVSVHKVDYCRYVVSDTARIIEVDDKFEELTGYSREDIKNGEIGQFDLIPEEERMDYVRMVVEQNSQSDIAYLEHRLQKKDGSILFVFCFGRNFYDAAEKMTKSEIILFDSANTYSMQIMMRQELIKSEVRLAKWEDKYRCDFLTGLLTREAFKNDIDLRLLGDEEKILFMMIDVDRFKQYNDTYGHKEGDEFLIEFSRELSMMFGERDLVCRMGGDEFAAAMFASKEVSDSSMIETAGRFCDKMNMLLSARKGNTGISVGVVISDDTTKTFNGLYEKADQALYDAKKNGRARMAVFR